MRPAVFVDRDGTLIDDPPPGYLRDPEQVRLLPGTAAAIRRLHQLGMAVVVVSNQAGIARGLVSWDAYHAVAERMIRLLSAEGASLDGVYICPHAPELDGECPCRKPRLLLYQRAIADLGLDPVRSRWVGDRLTDLLPALELGGRGCLVLTGLGEDHREPALARGFPVARDFAEAVSGFAAP
jgi:D-glycero-D-manno-heptose 1,7-bisphosphate phosphatase